MADIQKKRAILTQTLMGYSDKLEKLAIKSHGWGPDVRKGLGDAKAAIDFARAGLSVLDYNYVPTRAPRGAHVVAGKIYEIKPAAQKHYKALGGDTSACLVEKIDAASGLAIAVFTDDDGKELRASVKLSHFGKEAA